MYEFSIAYLCHHTFRNPFKIEKWKSVSKCTSEGEKKKILGSLRTYISVENTLKSAHGYERPKSACHAEEERRKSQSERTTKQYRSAPIMIRHVAPLHHSQGLRKEKSRFLC